MKTRCTLRRAHARQHSNGRVVHVRATLVLTQVADESESRRAYRSACPRCGATIRNVRMPNGGWGRFEGAEDLSRVKHPCFERRPTTKRGKDGNLDLFDDYFQGANSSP